MNPLTHSLSHPLAHYTVTLDLAQYNQHRLVPGNTLAPHPRELEYIDHILSYAEVPTDADADWYEDLAVSGPGQHDPLFEFLATEATLEQMHWFLYQEAAGEAGFGDLLAMTLVQMPLRAQTELARNFWDEMGNGIQAKNHNSLLHTVTSHFGINPTISNTVPESLQLNNLLVGLACHRRYAYHSVGALGVIEMTAPARVKQVAAGLARLGVPKRVRTYFEVHATLDIQHSREWNREVLRTLPETSIRPMCIGAYSRLWAGAQCFNRYRAEYGV